MTSFDPYIPGEIYSDSGAMRLIVRKLLGAKQPDGSVKDRYIVVRQIKMFVDTVVSPDFTEFDTKDEAIDRMHERARREL